MSAPPEPETVVFVYRWGKWRPELMGQRCVVLARGATNSALVRFEDGTEHIISRNALRKVKPSAHEEEPSS